MQDTYEEDVKRFRESLANWPDEERKELYEYLRVTHKLKRMISGEEMKAMKAAEIDTLEKEYIAIIEEEVGLDIETIRKTPVSDLRKIFEERDGGRRMTFTGDSILSQEEVEKAFDSAMEKLRNKQ